MVRLASASAAFFVLIVSVLTATGKMVAASNDVSSVQIDPCYSWRLRIQPRAPENPIPGSGTGAVEHIIQSRCRLEIPACKVTIEVFCKGSDADGTSLACQPCIKDKCTSKTPVCRFVSRTYKSGNCRTATLEACTEWITSCNEVSRLQRAHHQALKSLCPNSSEGYDILVRAETLAP